MQIRLLGRNAVIYGFGNVAVKAGTFLLIPLYTHAFTMADYGLFATALLVQQILVLLIDLGARSGLVRFAEEAEQLNDTGTLIGTSLAINLLGATLVCCILFPIASVASFHGWILFSQPLLSRLFVAAVCQSLFQTLVSYYRAKNDGVRYLIPNVGLTCLQLVSTWVSLRVLHAGLLAALDAIIFSYAILLLSILPPFIIRRSLGFSWGMFRKVMSFGLPLVIVASGNPIADAVGFSLLAHFRSLEEVAVYSLAAKFAEICGVLLMSPLQTSYEPLVYANIGSSRLSVVMPKLLTYIMLSFAFMSCATSFGALIFFRTLAPARYIESYPVMLLLLPMVGLRGVYSFGEVLLHCKKKTYVTGTLVGVGALASIALNRIAIPYAGVYANVVVCDLVAASVALLAIRQGLRAVPIKLQIGRLIAVAGIFATLSGCCLALQGSRLWVCAVVLFVVSFALLGALIHYGFFRDTAECPLAERAVRV